MKKLIPTILLAAFNASAQVQTILNGSYPGDTFSESAWSAWNKVNFNFGYVAARLATLSNAPAATVPANVVQSSSLSLVFQTNLTVAGTNVLPGTFTNVFAITNTAALTNLMSTDGGATWLSFSRTNLIQPVLATNTTVSPFVTWYLTTNVIGTNTYKISHLATNWSTNAVVFTNYAQSGVSLAVAGGTASNVTVKVFGEDYPAQVGTVIQFAGQTLDVSQGTLLLPPGTVNSNALDAATLAWLGSLGGSAGGPMNFDSGAIISDGSGDLTAAQYWFGGDPNASGVAYPPSSISYWSGGLIFKDWQGGAYFYAADSGYCYLSSGDGEGSVNRALMILNPDGSWAFANAAAGHSFEMDSDGNISAHATGFTLDSPITLNPVSAPAMPQPGQIYFDASDSHFYGFDGSNWKQLDN